MNTDINRSILNCEHVWIRSLIKKYNLSTDPIERQELMQKMVDAMAKINRMQMTVDCA